MKRLAASWMLAWLFFPGIAPVVAGEITGRVIEGASDRAVGGVEVLLLRRGTQEEAGSTVSDAEGRFRFADAAPGPYLVIANYLDVPYVRTDISLSDESSRATADLQVFLTTTSDEDVIIRADHLILQTPPEGLRVTEVIIFENTGERTYLGAVSPASPSGYGMFIPLPEGYTDLSAPSWLESRFFNPTESGFHMTMPIAPGSVQVTISYGLPEGLLGTVLDRDYPFAVKAVNVAVPRSAGLRVRSADLLEGQRVSIEGSSFVVSAGGPIAKGAKLRARALSGVMARGVSGGQITWGLCGLFTTALGFLWVLRRGRRFD